jgi:hypothetical protein
VALAVTHACAAMPTISRMVGTPVGANLTLGRRICAMLEFMAGVLF